MQLSFLFFGDKPDEKWILCRQMGISHAIAKLAPEITGQPAIDNVEVLRNVVERYEANGFKLIGLEGDQFDMTRIKLGLEGKEADLDRYCAMLENMGKLGIRLLCYNFMYPGWYRTHKNLPERGGAIVSGFVYEAAQNEPRSPYAPISENQLWENYHAFIEKVLPVAERSGVRMALHPDDPPVPVLHGISRIFTSADAVRKALALRESTSHGVTFCQGTYTTMNEDVESLIHEFGNRRKIFFVHIRDVRGTPLEFRETFHDNGPTNMYRMVKAYRKIGFDGPIRSDHVPTMEGEANENVGYEMKGNLFGIGYIKGLMEAAADEERSRTSKAKRFPNLTVL
jgi:mannonate dehydratase